MTYELTYVLRSPGSPLKAPHVQCRLCPAQVATAGGDLALLGGHLHTLHKVTGAGHLQLARAVTLLSQIKY